MARAVVASLPNVSPFKERIINCVKRRRTGFYTTLPEASHSPFPLFCLLSPHHGAANERTNERLYAPLKSSISDEI